MQSVDAVRDGCQVKLPEEEQGIRGVVWTRTRSLPNLQRGLPVVLSSTSHSLSTTCNDVQ